ncbi:MAG: glycosyltransferase family 2 protein [Gammaproteobacteria bacterium]|nr:glycosyltransferase family 2 protein [Gammaproteobacteria bacterium]
MFASVIFTTYNHPKWLEKTLWGFSAQSYRDFEIIVADDGSGEETRALVESIKSQIDIPIQHLWQKDEGFRKCRIMNKAVVASRGEYLIFTDGDCIPHPDFVKNHVELAAENTLLSGGYFKLPLDVSRAISKQDILNGDSTRPGWLLRHGVPFTPKIAKLFSHPLMGAILDALTITRATWNGHSSSTWKKHIIEANGFDERMQYGGQDREFGERLMNMGIKPRQVRYRCSCVHLDHGRGYARPESISKNRSIRKHTREQGITRTDYGIDSNPQQNATAS